MKEDPIHIDVPQRVKMRLNRLCEEHGKECEDDLIIHILNKMEKEIKKE